VVQNPDYDYEEDRVDVWDPKTRTTIPYSRFRAGVEEEWEKGDSRYKYWTL